MQFDGMNITGFLEGGEIEFEEFGLTAAQRCPKLLHSGKIRLRSFRSYLSADWGTLQLEVWNLYWPYLKPTHTMSALNVIVKQGETGAIDFQVYVLRYCSISGVAHALSPLDCVACLLDSLFEDLRRMIVPWNKDGSCQLKIPALLTQTTMRSKHLSLQKRKLSKPCLFTIANELSKNITIFEELPQLAIIHLQCRLFPRPPTYYYAYFSVRTRPCFRNVLPSPTFVSPDEYSQRKYLEPVLIWIESHESGRLNTQINHIFQPKWAAPSFTSPPFILHNPYRIVHIT